MRRIAVGLLGLGNVGSGVVKLLGDNAEAISHRLGGAAIELKRIAVRDLEKSRLVPVDAKLLTTDVQAVLDDPEIEIIIELIGGEQPARQHVLRAIENRKHIITANKALLAAHAEELFAGAEKQGIDFYFEASVGGGVPIIRALREGLASDRVHELVGIVNGTSNYLLSTMADDTTGSRSFADIVAEAQAAGYAEADASLDVDGWDAAHKLCVLVPLCFGARVQVKDLLIEGIGHLQPIDFRYAERFGYVIKPLVIARDHGDTVEARVHPTLIPRRFMLASVNDVYNAIHVASYALGHSLYYGRGAGMMPTAVAVISDLIEVARNLLSESAGSIPLRVPGSPGRLATKRIRPQGEIQSRFYLRFSVADQPGVLAQIAGILAEQHISISEMVQEGQAGSNEQSKSPVAVVITTHLAQEAAMQTALAKINRLPFTVEPTRYVRIFE